MNLIKRVVLSEMAMGLVLALTLSFSIALAQTGTPTVSADIPQELVDLAQDLGCQTSAECAEKFDANFEEGIALAQKHDIYNPEQEKLASAFKTEVLERLRTANQENFEEEILALANKILSEKPALARTLSVTRQTVNAAETIINTVKSAGVDIRTCQKSPENLSREQLIACVKAGSDLSNKGKPVEDYIPRENAKAGEVKQIIDLENSLLAGEYAGLGKINVEQAGQTCLKPDSESITDCARIAEKFFGAEGVKRLEEARQQTTRIKEYYAQGIEKTELVTPDGQKIIGRGAIKNACDSAFEKNNLGLARACGNFAVKNGYATQGEVEDGLKLLETFSQKAQGVDFDNCRFDPKSCREFLPDEFRPRFDSQFEIFRIMSESIGFDPSRCENTYDPDIGKRCLEGARKALSRIEEIAKNSPEARGIVDEIKSHIAEGERMTERLDEFHQDSRARGTAGPGGCRGPEECFKYCTQPGNSAECIAFGAKSQIFEQNTVVQRFNTVNERLSTPLDSGFNRYPYPYPPQQTDPGFNQYPYTYPPSQPVGPSPECFAAISSGDFAKAKIVCSNTTNTYEKNYPQPIQPPFPVCPAYSVPSPCPEGQIRQQASDARGCPAYGACTTIETYKPIDPKLGSCSSGQYWNGTACVTQTTARECPTGQYWNGTSCTASSVTACPSGMWWDGATNSCTSSSSCGYGQYWDPARQACQSSTQTYKQCDWSIDYLKMSTNTCVPRSTCYSTTNPDYNSSECRGVRSSATSVIGSCPEANQYRDPEKNICITQTPCPSGQYWDFVTDACATTTTTYVCGGFTTQTSCQASPGCGWANGACGGSMTTGNTCPTGQYWYSPPAGGAGYCTSSGTTTGSSCPTGYHYHGESGGFCMNDQENYSGTCYNLSGTATMTCPQNTYTYPGSCSSGQYWDYSSNSCKSNTSYGGCTGTTQTSCTSTSNCYWNSSSNYCYYQSSTPSGTACPSGQYWYTPPSGGAGYCMTSSTSSACPSGQYWSGSACVTSSPSYSTSCPSGQYWNGSACANTSPSDTPTTSCPSGQYWSGSACVSSSPTPSTSCASGQYWNGTACVSSTSSDTSGTYTPPPSNTSTPPPSYTPPPTDSSTTTTPPPTSMILCSQAGGSWTGAACNLAVNTSDQKAYLNYFQRQSDPLLAQVFRTFVDLFR